MIRTSLHDFRILIAGVSLNDFESDDFALDDILYDSSFDMFDDPRAWGFEVCMLYWIRYCYNHKHHHQQFSH